MFGLKNLGRANKAVLRARTGVSSRIAGSENAQKFFSAVGRPTMREAVNGGGARGTAAQITRRGKRRVYGGAAVLGANAVIGPRADSSGRSGYTNPRSTGGFA